MKIPLLDMKAQISPIRKEIDAAIAKVVDKGDFILGEEVKLFEEDVVKFTGSKFAIGVSNGTDAITLALEAIGIKKGDSVICPAFTYFATAGAVIAAGAIPAFVDIDPKTYCIDAKSIEKHLKLVDGRRQNTRAIIPVHLYGQCADMENIADLAKKYGLKVIEDTAQAFGAVFKGRRAGTIADCGTVSFFPGKNLGALGDAGMVLTDDNTIAEKIKKLRNQGADPRDKYNHVLLGHNNRLDTVQAAILRVKLKYLESWNRRRAENAAYYNKQLGTTGLATPFVPSGNTHIYHQYVLMAKDRMTRDKIMEHLHQKGIDLSLIHI